MGRGEPGCALFVSALCNLAMLLEYAKEYTLQRTWMIETVSWISF